MLKIQKILWILSIIFLFTYALYPIFNAVVCSTQAEEYLYSEELLRLPKYFTINHYKAIILRTNFLVWLKNNIVVSGGSAVLTIIMALPSAYVTARYEHKYKLAKIFGTFILFFYLLPPVLLCLPLYIIFHRAHLIDTLFGLIIANSLFCFPLAEWIFWGYLKNFPSDIIEAAGVDGAGRFQTFIYVVLPAIKISIISIAVLVFIISWTDFLFGFSFTQTDASRTISVGIWGLMEEWNIAWPDFLAASVLMSIPSLIIALFGFRYIIHVVEKGVAIS